MQRALIKTLLLILMLSLVLTACGGGDDEAESNDPPPNTAVVETTPVITEAVQAATEAVEPTTEAVEVATETAPPATQAPTVIPIVTDTAANVAQNVTLAPEAVAGLGGVQCQYDLTGQTVRFYHFGDLSGIYTFITLPVLAGFEDAIRYFNENGGVCGAEFAMEYRDTGGAGEAAQAAWDEFSARDDVNVIFLYLTEDSELLRSQAAEKKIPLIVSTGSALALYGENADQPGYVFSVTPLYPDQLGAFCKYIAENWDQFGIPGDPMIGHVSWLGAFGQSTDTEESRAYCQSRGVGYTRASYYIPIVPDITTQVQQVLDSGANILYTTSLADGPARLAATVETLGYGDKVLLAGPNWVLDTSALTLGGQAMVGFVGQLPYVWWDEVEHPGIQLVNDQWLQNRFLNAQDQEAALQLRNIAYLIAWTAVDIYKQIVISTVNRVGFENLNGAAIYETLISGETFNGLGGVLPFNFDATRRSANQTRMGTIQFVESEEGMTPRIIPLTDWFETPDLIPGGADVPVQ